MPWIPGDGDPSSPARFQGFGRVEQEVQEELFQCSRLPLHPDGLFGKREWLKLSSAILEGRLGSAARRFEGLAEVHLDR
jgi:hypothetical protein